MSVAQQPEITHTPEKPEHQPHLRFWQEELRYLWRGLLAWPLYALMFISAVLFVLAYQAKQDFAFPLGIPFPADHLYVVSFNQPEANKEISFRWSSDESVIRFEGVGRVPYARLDLTMAVGGRPANLAPAKVQLWQGNKLLGEAEVGPGDNPYSFEYRAEGSKLEGNLEFTLRTLNPFKDSGHNLPLGVVVSKVRLVAGLEAGRPVIPALPQLALLLTGLVAIYLMLYRSGWAAHLSGIIAGVFAVGAAGAIAFARFYIMPVVTPLVLLLLLAYVLLAVGLRVTALWVKGGIPVKQMRWLGLVFFAAFVFKAVGLVHPAFLTIDHWFRIHQVLRLWENPGEFWSQYYNVTAGQSVTGSATGSAVLGQWGLSFTLPYSPLFYLFAAPLALIWPGHSANLYAAVNILASWLEVSQLFLIYIIARRAYNNEWGGRAGVIAAAFMGFYPLSFLLFSDGGYNSILAHWLTLLFIALLLGVVNSNKPARRETIFAGIALGAALLAHTSTLLLVGVFTVVLFIMWVVRKETRFGARRLAMVGAIGFGLSLLLYYGYYVVGFFTQSLPALLGKLGSNGSLGQTQALLGNDLLSGFWPQLWAHFRLFPFILTLLALAALWPYRKETESGNDLKPENARLIYPVWLAWLVVFLLFALADLKLNLLQKHMLFAAPLLCLGAGFALSWGWEWLQARQKTATKGIFKLQPASIIMVLTSLLIAFMVWQGVVTWYGRVFYYTLQPGSG